MNSTDIDLLSAEKGNPSISIVVNTHKYSRDRVQNPKLIENAILKAKSLLTNNAWPKDKIRLLNEKLDSILEQVDLIRMQEAIAIFLSPNIFKIYLLPFPVQDKVNLGKSFEIRDMIYFNQFLKPYYLLAISKKRVRLLKGSGRDLQEISNSDFPKQYTEEYEYAHASIGSSSSAGMKGFEKDKSILQDIRMNAFFKHADTALNKYLKEDTPLFVAGVTEELVNYEHITHHIKNITGKISGNYDIDAVHPLAESAWKKIEENVRTSHQALLKKLEEETGKHRAVDGIIDVWKAAKQGKGLILLLEKDYKVTAYQDPANHGHLSLMPPAGKYDIIFDAADDVIEIVNEKKGRVVILENGELQNFGRIALLMRYQ